MSTSIRTALPRLGTLVLLLPLAVAQTALPQDAQAGNVLLAEAQPGTLTLPNGSTRQVHLVKVTPENVQFKNKAADTTTLGYTAKSGNVRKIETGKGDTFVLNAKTKRFERSTATASKTDTKQADKKPPALYGAEVLQGDETAWVLRLDQFKEQLTKVLALPPAAPDATPLDLDRQAAFRRLQAHRFLARVPYENLQLDDELNKTVQATAGLLAKLGKLDHKPPNAGLPEAEYKLALRGAEQGNLSMGRASLVPVLDEGWMGDFEGKNHETLVHRRWCINPAMLKVGFGASNKYFAMFAHDKSQPRVPAYDIVAFPTYGLMPVSFFDAKYAWNVSLNPAVFKDPDKSVKVQVHEVDRALKKQGTPLPLAYFNPTPVPVGVPLCIIFRPDGVAVEPGKIYLVEIEGVQRRTGPAGPLRYVVAFVAG